MQQRVEGRAIAAKAAAAHVAHAHAVQRDGGAADGGACLGFDAADEQRRVPERKCRARAPPAVDAYSHVYLAHRLGRIERRGGRYHAVHLLEAHEGAWHAHRRVCGVTAVAALMHVGEVALERGGGGEVRTPHCDNGPPRRLRVQGSDGIEARGQMAIVEGEARAVLLFHRPARHVIRRLALAEAVGDVERQPHRVVTHKCIWPPRRRTAHRVGRSEGCVGVQHAAAIVAAEPLAFALGRVG